MNQALSENILPEQGELYLLKQFYPVEQSQQWFDRLYYQLNWQQERLFIYGRWLDVPRLMCWYGDTGADYQYSGVNHQPLSWTDDLTQIRRDVEQVCQKSFNSVMANLYRNGRDSMGCHADDEKELGVNPLIASVSLGETRLLRFKQLKSSQKLDIELDSGDLLVMAGEIQHHWRHELPKTRRPKKARINLTFRKIITGEAYRF